MDFESWKRRVNAMIVRVTGIGCDDLPDFRYFDAWRDEASPSATAYDVLVSNGYYA